MPARLHVYIVAGVIFGVLATANAAGYRYGGSDQAFYIPALTHALVPDSFPRDAALIDAQAKLVVVDDVFAAVSRASGLSTEALFFSATSFPWRSHGQVLWPLARGSISLRG